MVGPCTSHHLASPCRPKMLQSSRPFPCRRPRMRRYASRQTASACRLLRPSGATARTAASCEGSAAMPWKCEVPRSSHSARPGRGTAKSEVAETEATQPPAKYAGPKAPEGPPTPRLPRGVSSAAASWRTISAPRPVG